jgi:hypothetical protein
MLGLGGMDQRRMGQCMLGRGELGLGGMDQRRTMG